MFFSNDAVRFAHQILTLLLLHRATILADMIIPRQFPEGRPLPEIRSMPITRDTRRYQILSFRDYFREPL